MGIQYKGSRKWDAGSREFSLKKGAGQEVSTPDFAPSRKRTESAALGWQREHYLGYLRGVSGRNIVVGEFKDSGLYFQHSQIIFGNASPSFRFGHAQHECA